MRDIKELSLQELQTVLKQWGEKDFRAKQILEWIYSKAKLDFSGMSSLSGPLRKKLEQQFFISGLSLVEALSARDGTEKLLFKTRDANFIESVIIPAEGRVSVCLSTQAGCRFACKFCASGAGGFKRNLSWQEIIDQLLHIKSRSPKLSHVVFMGTGEPLDNYDNLLRAIRLINSSQGFAIGARRITISTCGLIPQIRKLAGEGLQIELSVSLHASSDAQRSTVMPVNKKYPLKLLLDACRDYIKQTHRQVTFEYCLIEGFNSDLQNARDLSKMLKGLNCKVNIIAVNPIKESGARVCNKMQAIFFRDRLLKEGITATIRKSRGDDINAACGQLRLRYEKK